MKTLLIALTLLTSFTANAWVNVQAPVYNYDINRQAQYGMNQAQQGINQAVQAFNNYDRQQVQQKPTMPNDTANGFGKTFALIKLCRQSYNITGVMADRMTSKLNTNYRTWNTVNYPTVNNMFNLAMTWTATTTDCNNLVSQYNK